MQFPILGEGADDTMKAKKAEPHQYANLVKSQYEDTKGALQLI